jgi:hypothetical protein
MEDSALFAQLRPSFGLEKITGDTGRFRYWLPNARPRAAGLSDQHKSIGSKPPSYLVAMKNQDACIVRNKIVNCR